MKQGRGDKKNRTTNVRRGARASTTVTDCCIYFYYFTFEQGDPIPKAKCYYYFDKSSNIMNLKNTITNLAVNARKDGDLPPCHGDDLSDLWMRRKSYYVVVVDDPTFKLDGTKPLDLFLIHTTTEAKTFTPAMRLEIVMSDTGSIEEKITAAYCKNLMTKQSGGPLKYGDWEEFDLVLYPKRGEELYPDSGGTNMGPPVPPP